MPTATSAGFRMCGAAGVDYLCLSQGSTTAAMFTAPAGMLKRWQLLPMTTTAVICIGANDPYNGNGSTIIANINAFIASLKAAGIVRVFVTTLMPKTYVNRQLGNDRGTRRSTSSARARSNAVLNVNSGIRGVGTSTALACHWAFRLDRPRGVLRNGTGERRRHGLGTEHDDRRRAYDYGASYRLCSDAQRTGLHLMDGRRYSAGAGTAFRTPNSRSTNRLIGDLRFRMGPSMTVHENAA